MNTEHNMLRDELIASGRQFLAGLTGGADNDNTHQARYRLYDLATRQVGTRAYQALRRDPRIIELARQVFPASCAAGITEECAIARDLLANPHLTFGHIYRNYHGPIYEALMEDELDYLKAQEDLDMSSARVVYIGGGAMPIPAMLLAQRVGCKITIVDPDETSCTLARALIKKVNLDHLVSVEQVAGQHYNYSECDLVCTANWIPCKDDIFARLGEFANIRYCVFRSAAEHSPSFVINDEISLCQVCDHGFQLKHRTKKRDGISLVSLVFSLKEKNEAACIYRRKQQGRVVDSMTDLIGNTPMLRLDPAKTGLKNIDVYAKLEHMNPFGSIKDRTAWGMLKPHIENIRTTGKTVLELSSGNAARGLQAIAAIHGAQFETASNRIRVAEMRRMLALQGAKISPIEGVDPEDAYSALNMVDAMASDDPDRYFYTDQYRNPNNDGTHYSQTGREILEDVGKVDIFAGAVGTAGTTVGIARRLRESNADMSVIGVISDKDAAIPGIRHKDEIFDIGPFDESNYDDIADIHPDMAIDGMMELSRQFGVMAGPSSGATYMALLNKLKDMDETLSTRKTAVFIVCDRAEMYLGWLAEQRPELFG